MSPGRLPINGNLPLSINKPPTIRRMIPKKNKFLPNDSIDFFKSPLPPLRKGVYTKSPFVKGIQGIFLSCDFFAFHEHG